MSSKCSSSYKIFGNEILPEQEDEKEQEHEDLRMTVVGILSICNEDDDTFLLLRSSSYT
jgi:hypothetical protein